MKKNKENKQMLELGSKQRAGQLISSYLRAIGTKKTELIDVVVGPDKTERKIVSKAEALAYDIWKKALSKNTDVDSDVDDKMRLEYRKMLLDRIEGKPGDNPEDEKVKRGNIPDRISEMNKKKLNSLAEGK